MFLMESEFKGIRWPKDWLPLIDEARGSQPFSEFVKDCVAARIGKRRMPEAKKRGRPPKSQNAD